LIIEINIKNWEKFNPRKDVKSTSWFRFENNFFDDPDFYCLKNDQKLIWIYLLSISSKEYCSAIKINSIQMQEILKIPENFIFETLTKLEKEIQCITTNMIESDRIRSNPIESEPYETKRNVTEHNVTERNTVALDIKKQIALPKGKSQEKNKCNSSETWEYFTNAFFQRYKTMPVRNLTVNSQMLNFVKRVGIKDAPLIAEFYVTHNNFYYIKNCHKVGLLLNDAEKLATEWKTGNTMTDQRARQIDQTQTNFEAIDKGFAAADEIIKKRKEKINGSIDSF
jgi:hypothetical protein